VTEYDNRRNVILELRLQVAKAKLEKLHRSVDKFLETCAAENVSSEDVTDAVKRLREINEELQNTAPNLHE
jgi:hypothetical protein